MLRLSSRSCGLRKDELKRARPEDEHHPRDEVKRARPVDRLSFKVEFKRAHQETSSGEFVQQMVTFSGMSSSTAHTLVLLHDLYTETASKGDLGEQVNGFSNTDV